MHGLSGGAHPSQGHGGWEAECFEQHKSRESEEESESGLPVWINCGRYEKTYQSYAHTLRPGAVQAPESTLVDSRWIHNASCEVDSQVPVHWHGSRQHATPVEARLVKHERCERGGQTDWEE